MQTTDPPQFKRYGREVRAEQMRHGVLRLPHGFLGLRVQPLWFHPNYSLVESFIERRLQSNLLDTEAEASDSDAEENVDPSVEGKRQFHIVGTPGIGKTYFGHYWFYRQAKENRRVIWRTKGDSATFLYYDFSLEEPLVHVSSVYVVLQPWEGDEQIWLIVDGRCGGLYHDGPLLQCVSPGRDGYHEFSKDLGIVLYLEAWTLDELKQCRDALGLGFSDAALEERFFYCGGMPREVFNRTKTLEQLKQMMEDAAARAPSWEAVIRHAAGDGEKDPQISDYLLHYRLPPELDLNAEASDRLLHRRLIFGSKFIEGRVFELHQQQGFQKAREFFCFCQEIPRARALAGQFFEKFVHHRLQQGGGEYRIKPLGLPAAFQSVSSMSLRPLYAKRLRRWTLTKEGPRRKRSKQEVTGFQFSIYGQTVSMEKAALGKEEAVGLASLEAGCFVSPYSANFKSLDSLVTPSIMIQCTCSLDHKLFWGPVLEIVQEFDRWYCLREQPISEYYQLLFVVPDSQFRDFTFQCYKKDDGSDYKEVQDEMKRVRQFALAFPWN